MRRVFAPEVVQTSAMDCGPAALRCLLEGFGVSVSYGRLREACQTDVDGTSIDTMEVIAKQLGLEAEQVMLPPDHLLLDEAGALPAIVVVRLPNGFTHFVVAWRRHGPFVQIMDPASGRRWVTCERFREDVYLHEMNVPVESFRQWIEGDDFGLPLARRMRELGCSGRTSAELRARAREGGWRRLALLDAAVRMTTSLVTRGAARAGGEAERLVRALLEDEAAIPEEFFTAREATAPTAEGGEETVRLRGAVLVRASGLATTPREERPPLPPDLARALEEPPARPLRELFRLLRQGGWLTPAALLVALALAATGATVEGMLMRAALDLPRQLGVIQQRLGAAAALVLFVAGARALAGPVASSSLRIGRQIEVRLRQAFLEKVPRLGDRYFQSRPISDMADRAHAVNMVRALPELGAQLVRASMELVVTAAAIVWLDPPSAPIALAACGLSLAVPLAWQPVLRERDLRVRSHGGALARMSLDALLGLMPIRTHGADLAMRREHEALVVEWGRASRGFVRASAWVDAVQSLAATLAIVWMVTAYVARAPDTSGVLLLTYWGLNMPLLGDEIAIVLRQYPGQRNVTLRLLEPLGATEEPVLERPEGIAAPDVRGASIEMAGVSVVAGGHLILEGIDLTLQPGEEVGVVGASGAGKSSLAGLLLGWHRAAAGRVLVDGAPLDALGLERLRKVTAWVDPAIQIWNRPLYDNLLYGARSESKPALAQVLESAEIQPLLDRLPEGMQTPLGEGGALVSGGEGQRVRLGRSMMRAAARLVVFDEPFRGLDRERRRVLLARARAWWKGATFLCITHDVAETLDFHRVLVVHRGRIVEDGDPRALAADPGSRFGAMLGAERAVLETMWGGPEWRRLRMERGALSEAKPSRAPEVGDRREETA